MYIPKKEDILSAQQFKDIVAKIKSDEKEEKSNKLAAIAITISVVVLIAGIAYLIYRYLAPDYLEDFEDDFEDDEYYYEEDDYVDEEEDFVTEDDFE